MMNRFEEWHTEIRKQVEKVAQQLHDLSAPQFLAYPTEPVLYSAAPEIETSVLSIYHKMEHGMRGLMRLLNDPSIIEGIHEGSKLAQSMADMSTVASVVIQQMRPSLHLMTKGESLQSILGISDSTLHSLYALSRYLYEHQHYDEASGAFYLLSLLNPSYHIFWIGLGNCEYFLRRYQEALLAYMFAAQIDPSDPTSHLLMARCHMALGNFSAATANISIAEMTCSDSKVSERVKKQADQIRKDVQRHAP